MEVFKVQKIFEQGGMFILLPIVFLVLYFLMIRPQNKQKKAEEELRNSLKIGDTVIISSGIVGRIVAMKDGNDTLVLETASDHSKVTVKRWAVYALENAMAQKQS